MQKRYPFKFLDSYNQNDTDIYFGRDEEVSALYEMIFQNPVLLVYGTSGTGKTSLIQCGLAGRFKSYDWLALTIRRGTDINASLEKVLSDAGGNDIDEDELTDKSAKKLPRLLQLIKGVYLNSFKPIYLIFDQFEELYVLGTKVEQEKFIESIKEILKAEQPVKMIFSIREEYLGHLFEFEKQVPQLLRKKLRVEPMTLNKLNDFLRGINNYKLSNVKVNENEFDAITEGIFERLRGKKKTLTIQLPYLQVFLDKLYLEITKDQTRTADAVIGSDVLNRLGDIGDVLRNFLEEEVSNISKKLSEGNRTVGPETVWKILSPFSTLKGTKEPISKKELANRLKDIDPSLINEAVESFVNSRIVNFSENTNLYELAHDSLALRIAEKRSDEEIALMEVSRLIKNQVSLKQDAKEFFSKKQLNFIEPFLHKLTLSDEESDLIAQSKDAILKAETKTRKKRRRVLVTIAASTIGVIALLSWFLWQASVAKNSNKLLLANNYWNSSKSDKGDDDYVYALANAAKAFASSDDEGMRKRILIDMEHHWPGVMLNNIITNGSQLSLATYGESDSIIITVGEDLKIRKWNAITGAQVDEKDLEVKTKPASRPYNTKQEIIGFTADGKKIMTVDTNGYLRFSFVSNGKEEKASAKFEFVPYQKNTPPSFSRDGKKMICQDPYHILDSLIFVDRNGLGSYKKFKIRTDSKGDLPSGYYGYDEISSLTLNRDGTRFLYIVNDTSLYIGNIESGEINRILPDSSTSSGETDTENINFIGGDNSKRNTIAFNRVSFTAEENMITAVCKDNTVRFFNVATRRQVGAGLKHQTPVQVAFMIPSTNRVFTRDEKGSTFIWDRTTGNLLSNGVKLVAGTQRVKFRSDGKQLLVVENNNVFVWDLIQKNYSADNQLIAIDLPGVTYSPDLSKVLIPEERKDNIVFQLIDAGTKIKIGQDIKLDRKFNEDELDMLIRGEKIFSDDNKKLLIQTSRSELVLWDIEKQRQVGSENIFFRPVEAQSGNAGRQDILPFFSPDGKRVVAFNTDSTFRLYSAETGHQIGGTIPLAIHNDRSVSWDIVFSPDSTRFLTYIIYVERKNEQDQMTGQQMYRSEDIYVFVSETQLWNNSTGKPIGKKIVNELYRGNGLEQRPDVDPKPFFDPKGRTFINPSRESFQIIDAEKGNQVANNITSKFNWDPFYTADGKYVVAIINDSTIRYFDASSGKPAPISIEHQKLYGYKIVSPDSRFLIIGDKENGNIKLFDTKSGKEIREKADYKHQSADVLPCFSPDGNVFVTADRSGILRLWNTETGEQKGSSLKYKLTKVREINFTGDGKKILGRVFDENTSEFSFPYTGVIWDAETEELIGEALPMSDGEIMDASKDGRLIALYKYDEGSRQTLINQLIPIEKGDLDIPAKLLELQVLLAAGYNYDSNTDEKTPLTPEEFRKTKDEYNKLAAAHYRICNHSKYNFWKRFHAEEAKKIKTEEEWQEKKYSADQFNILPAFNEPTTSIEANNGKFLKPNQAITSKNGQYLMAYQRNGDLVIYKKDGMQPIWSSNTAGKPTYRVVMQFDGNLVIYSGDPETKLGQNAVWSTDTWRDNRGAHLVLEDDGNLILYNPLRKDSVIWQSKTSSGLLNNWQ